MSVSTAKSFSSLIRPMAIPATGALIFTPASIMDRVAPHTLAMELEPFDSVISDTTRSTYGPGAVGARQHAGADDNRAHGGGVAAVDARLAGDNAPAHHFLLDVLDDALDVLDLIATRRLVGRDGQPLARRGAR